MVAEGVKTSKVVMELADRHGVEMPIAGWVYKVVHEGATATDAYRGLLVRDHRAEMHNMPRD
jgi:glycerol-3-phosphate dehydrogenase (NAD(P)+)